MHMFQSKAGGALILLALGGMLVGCGGGKKAQIQELEQQLTQAQQQSADLQSSLDASQQDLATKEQEVSTLQTSLKQSEQKAAQAEVEVEQAKATWLQIRDEEIPRLNAKAVEEGVKAVILAAPAK